MQRLVDFWNPLRDDSFVHPDDAFILDRCRHGFWLNEVPVPWTGPILTAMVFLLYLNPGLENKPEWLSGQERHRPLVRANLSGCEPNYMYHGAYRQTDGGARWLSKRLRGVADEESIQSNIAVLELVPYRSQTFSDWAMIPALASSRLMVDVVHKTLLPRACAGEILIVCARAATAWGLSNTLDIPNVLVANSNNRAGLLTENTKPGQRIRSFLQPSK
jgi:hypothetical protein